MKWFKPSKASLAIAFGLASAGYIHTSYGQPAVVSVDLSKQLYVGDTTALDRNKFFNIHSSPGEPGAAEQDMLYIKNELNAQYGRIFWGPMALNGSADYPNTEQAMLDGEQSIINAKAGAFYEFGTNRMVATEHPRSVLAPGNDPVEGARWAADYFEYYFEDERRPLFYEPMNEPFVHASDFVDGPWDPVANEAVQRHMATWFAEIGKTFDQRGLNTNVIGFSSAWPSFELSDFSHWQSRQKMFMDLAGDHMDGFSFHLYDGVNVEGQDNFRSGSNAEAIIDMIEAYSHIKWGEVKDHAVTEYGGIIDGYPLEYSAAKSAQELRSYNHILFSLLEREDRILTSTPFITGISKWFYDANNFNPYSATVLRPDPDKIISNKVNGYLPTEKAYFYKLWSDVKGNRVAVDTLDPDLAVQAFNYGSTLYLALNNYEDSSKDVDLRFIYQGNSVSQVRAKRLDVPYDQAANYTDEILSSAPSSITMQGHETVVLEYEFAQPISPDGIVRKSSYYAQTYLQPIVENTELAFTFNDIDVGQSSMGFADVYQGVEFDQAVVDAIQTNEINRLTSTMRSFDRQLTNIIGKHSDAWRESADFARLVQRAERSATTAKALQYHYAMHGYNASERTAILKMGVGRKHDKSKQPVVLVNGHRVEVPNDWRGYDQTSREDFFGVIEIPVPAKFLKANTNVELIFPDTQGHVSSLILEVDTQEPLQTVAVTGLEMQKPYVAIKKDRPYRLFANVMPQTATNKYLLWQSSDESIATVEDGLVTPIAPGFVEISAISEDGEFSASTSVEVKDELTVRNTIVITNDVSSMEPTNSITLDIDYSTSIDRDVAFELIGPQGNWLGLSRVTVPAGEGTTQITLSFEETLAPGTGYKIIAALREVGGDWRTSVDGHTITGVEIASPDAAPVPVDNLLGANGDFEQGTLGDWQRVFGSIGDVDISQEAAYNGSYGIKFDTANGKAGISLGENVLPTALMKANKKFKLSFQLKRLTSGGWSGGMSQFINQNGGWKSSGQKWFGGTLTGEWQLVEIEFDGLDWPDTQTSFEVNLMTSGHTWYADDFVLEEVPTAP